MASIFLFLFLFQALLLSRPSSAALFREYIGAEFTGVRFPDVPIHAGVDVHFILAFAIDYTTAPSPTNGKFNVFWDNQNLSPAAVAAIKRSHPNVKVAVSLGGDTVSGPGQFAYFAPSSISSWVDNAVASLTALIRQYHLDGIDIDYEHFQADAATFAECIGQLVTRLKTAGVISFASIAPFDDGGDVQSHYLALWRKYGKAIDYVNFQFYAYDRGTTVAQFLSYFDKQRANYKGATLLASFNTEKNPGGLTPANGFFRACNTLKRQGKLGGIFVWTADTSLSNRFRYEKQAQSLLAA